mgnify:FL=1|tara:strand:+ start:2586 stop:4088 length:1503 start_codon:yes stop_codon:yes gene_type:complete
MATYDTLPPGAMLVPQQTGSPQITQSRTDMPLNLPQGAMPVPFTPAPSPQAVPESAPGFLERSADLLKPRYERGERMRQEYMSESGIVDAPEYYASRVTNSMGAFFDVAGEGLLTVLSTLTPDRWERLFKENLAAGGTALMNTDQAKQLMKMWDEFDPLTKDRLANLTDTAAGVSQFAKSPTSMIGEKLSASAIKSDKQGLASKVLDQTTTAKTARGAEIGKQSNRQFQTNFDEDILNTVVSLPGVTGKTKLAKLLEKLNKAEEHLNANIQKTLVKSNIKIPVQTINQALDIKLKELYAGKPEFADDKKLAAIVKRVKKLNTIALKEYKGKPIELLQARRNLDRIVKETFGDSLYEGAGTSRTVVKQVRDVYNDLMQQSVDDGDIRALMQRQHHMIEAISNAAYANTKQTPKNLLQRTASVAERHPFLAAGVLGLSEQGGRALDVPPGILATGAAGLGAYGLSTPNVRRVAGGALQAAPVSTAAVYGGVNSLQGMMNEEQ